LIDQRKLTSTAPSPPQRKAKNNLPAIGEKVLSNQMANALETNEAASITIPICTVFLSLPPLDKIKKGIKIESSI
jgi:hypothetical protein